MIKYITKAFVFALELIHRWRYLGDFIEAWNDTKFYLSDTSQRELQEILKGFKLKI